MSNPDEWPLPTYNCGSSKHLHAIGVIANRFNALERGMFDLYSLYTQGRLARELSDFFFLALNERTRMQALKKLVHTYEKRRRAREFFDSLYDYFEWCWEARNQIIHAEFYPAMLGGNPLEISLVKRKSKQSAEPGYLKFTVPELREIADKIQEGVQRCAAFRINLRQRTTPPRKWSVSMKIEGRVSLPSKLVKPRSVVLAPHPLPSGLPHLRARSQP